MQKHSGIFLRLSELRKFFQIISFSNNPLGSPNLTNVCQNKIASKVELLIFQKVRSYGRFDAIIQKTLEAFESRILNNRHQSIRFTSEV